MEICTPMLCIVSTTIASKDNIKGWSLEQNNCHFYIVSLFAVL